MCVGIQSLQHAQSMHAWYVHLHLQLSFESVKKFHRSSDHSTPPESRVSRPPWLACRKIRMQPSVVPPSRIPCPAYFPLKLESFWVTFWSSSSSFKNPAGVYHGRIECRYKNHNAYFDGETPCHNRFRELNMLQDGLESWWWQPTMFP